ncbi:MAG TPA: hypothetical protein VFK03_02395 [Candidatus Saccharimonadales bacterium]|nr:hypothetical protein [Candidatus Saccharimonadales bacterium]
MQSDSNAKQQIVDRIKKATNILVTVSRDPSVDELAAALSLTLMLNKLDKHATAVFSGQVPSAMEFLKPDKTFENTVDSLRDFIIALDKEKADRLRYKVEEDVVRIFITPYKTTLSQDDLKFSQGDFNVELIVALGVDQKDDLDAAITAHGRILHDSTTVTINANNDKNSLGEVDWSDDKASSLCEMLMSLSEALKSNLLDEQMATALLTGLVAATERFRNDKTSPRVMTMAAQLMAAGANQQLIADKLEEGHELPTAESKPVAQAPDGSTHLKENKSEKVNKAGSDDKPAETDQLEPNEDEPKTDGSLGEMEIEHEAKPEISEEPRPAPRPADPDFDEARREADKLAPASTLSVDDLKKDIEAANQAINQDQPAETEPEVAVEAPTEEPPANVTPAEPETPLTGKPVIKTSGVPMPAEAPTFDATFNATTDEAEEEKRRSESDDRNHALLSHGRPTSSKSAPAAAVNSFSADEQPSQALTDIETAPAEQPPVQPERQPTMAELEARAHALANPEAEQQSSLDNARAAVDQAIESSSEPAHQPTADLNAQPMSYIESPIDHQPDNPSASTDEGLPPLPNFADLPPLPGDQPAPPTPSSNQPPLVPPPTQFGSALPPLDSDQSSTPPANEPGQFKLPGQ